MMLLESLNIPLKFCGSNCENFLPGYLSKMVLIRGLDNSVYFIPSIFAWACTWRVLNNFLGKYVPPRFSNVGFPELHDFYGL